MTAKNAADWQWVEMFSLEPSGIVYRQAEQVRCVRCSLVVKRLTVSYAAVKSAFAAISNIDPDTLAAIKRDDHR